MQGNVMDLGTAFMFMMCGVGVAWFFLWLMVPAKKEKSLKDLKVIGVKNPPDQENFEKDKIAVLQATDGRYLMFRGSYIRDWRWYPEGVLCAEKDQQTLMQGYFASKFMCELGMGDCDEWSQEQLKKFAETKIWYHEMT